MIKNPLLYFLLLIICLAGGCHTGIESTKTIKLSKTDKKELATTPEELLMADIHIPVIAEWQKEKPFIVADNRISLVFDPFYFDMPVDSLVGKIIEYNGVISKPTPGGSDEAVIEFLYNGKPLTYSTGKSMQVAQTSITSMDVPMVIDPQLIDDARKLLLGRKVWTKSQLWYDENENKITGRKFVPVTITDIMPGSIVFPLKVFIKDENGNDALLFMNIGSVGIESRTFQNLFTLTDPKNRYPNITPENWNAICNGKVSLGMTKEECKLALGNPADVNSGHDWNSTIDLWQYPDGTYLQFQDGLLISFR